MKLSIDKADLQRGLGRIQAVVEKRTSMPILANVLITVDDDGLELAGTDLEVGIRSRHAAQVKKTGGLSVSAKKLYEIIRELPDEPVSLESTSNAHLQVKCARSDFKLAGSAADEYPTLPEFNPTKTASVQAAVLSTMIERTMYGASLDETRYNLNGVYFEVLEGTDKIRMVATDGHRLACIDRGLGDSLEGLQSGVILPRKGLGELKRLVDEDDADEIELAFEGNNGLARKGDVTLVMRLIEGKFPDYHQVLPKSISFNLTLASDTFLQALRRVVLLSSERSRAVRLDLADGLLALSSSNADLGDAREELDVDYSGDALSIGFNARYLLDALTALRAKEVRFGLQDELSPAQLIPTDDEDTLAVVMPMRI